MLSRGGSSNRSYTGLIVIGLALFFVLWLGYSGRELDKSNVDVIPGQEELITKWIGLSSGNSSQVVLTEYASASATLTRAQKRSPVVLFSVIGVQEEIESISHFLHYNINVLKIPQEDMMIALNSNKLTDNNLKEAASVLYAFGIRNFLFWEGMYSSQSMFRIRLILFNIFTNAGRLSRDSWVVHSDADEFHGFPVDVISMLQNVSDQGYNAVIGVWRDRLSATGSLNAVIPFSPDSQSIFEQFPVVCNFRTKSKVSAYKAFIDTTEGNHNIAPGSLKVAKVYPQHLNVHHFKWVDGVIPRMERRVDVKSKQNRKAGALNVGKILQHLKSHNNAVCVTCPDIKKSCSVCGDKVREEDGCVLSKLPIYEEFVKSEVSKHVRSFHNKGETGGGGRQ